MTAETIVAAEAAKEANTHHLSQLLDELHEAMAMLTGAHAVLAEIDDSNEQAYASCLVGMARQRLSEVHDGVDTMLVTMRREARHG